MTTSSPSEDDAIVAPADPSERCFGRWATAVGTASTLAFAWMVTLGRWDLFQERAFSNLLDVQARSIAHGHLWVPDGSMGFEGFVIDGRTYAYFGVFPSLLRLPVFALTDRFDGRLSAVSMLIAFVLAYASTARLVGRTHRLVAPDGRWSRGGLVVAIAFLAAVGVGSNLLYLGSSAIVYHEAILWGVAAVLASFASIVSWLGEPRLRHVVAAGAWATVAWLSRGSVGLGPTVALGLLGLSVLAPNRATRWLAPVPDRARRGWRAAAPLLVAGSVGAIAFAGINVAKFGSPTELPMDKQIQSVNPLPSRAAALEEYGGTIFSPRLAPAVLVQTMRPDLVRPSTTWPWLRFSRADPPPLLGVVFDTVEPSSGLVVTHPLLLVLSGIGLVAVARPRRRPPEVSADGGADGGDGDGGDDLDPSTPPGAPGTAALRPLLLGGALGTLPVLTIAFISQRYVTDLLPPLLVAAAAGLTSVDGWISEDADESTARRRSRTAVAGAVALAITSIAVTLSTTWTFQRFVSPPDAEARRSWLRTAIAVSDVIGRPPEVEHATSIRDAPGRADVLLVVGECDGLYVGQSDGVWTAIEVTGAAGVPRLEVTGRPTVGAAAVTLLTAGAIEVVLSSPDASSVRVDLVRDGHVTQGTPFEVAGPSFDLTVDLDGNLPAVQVFHDDRDVAYLPGRPTPGPHQVGPGGDGVEVREVEVATPICDALTGR